MRKGIKILGKVFSAAVLLLIIVPVALSLLLDIPAVQNYAVHRAACFVSRKLETTVSIDRVDIGIFSKVRVKGFYVEDYQRDTLLYVGKLDAFITSFGIFGGGLELSRGEIADARLYLRQTPGGEMNIKQIVDRISDPDKPKKGNFRLSLKKASIENMDLCLERLDHRDPEHGIAPGTSFDALPDCSGAVIVDFSRPEALTSLLAYAVKNHLPVVLATTGYTPEQIENILFSGRWGNNTILAFIRDKTQPHRQIPFVEKYKIVFHGPFKAEVIIYDKSIVGYVSYMSSYMYFDRDGIIVESSPDCLPGVPWITGLEFGRIVLYQHLPVKDPKIFEEILNLTQQLSVYHIQVDRIRFGSSGQPSLTIGQMEVTLGDGGDVDGKLSLLNDILRDHPELKDKKGTLELDGYSDTGNDGTIPFKLK